MKTIRSLFLAVGILAVALLLGCLPSLHPIYEKGDLAYDARLEGVWVEDAKTGEGAEWILAPRGENAYKLTIRQKEGVSELVAHLARIGGQEFLDLWPEPKSMEELPRGEWFRAMLVPGHLFLRVMRDGDVVKLRMLDMNWLDKLLEENRNALKVESLPQGGICITASTPELRAFLAKHATNGEAWSKEGPDLRKKP